MSMSNNAQYLKQLVEGGTPIKDLPEPKSIIGGYLYQLCMSGMGAPTDAQVKAAIDELAKTHPELFSGLTEDDVKKIIESYKSEFVGVDNVKTINGESIIGKGNIVIEGGNADFSQLEFAEKVYKYEDVSFEWIEGKFLTRSGNLSNNDASKYADILVNANEQYELFAGYYSQTQLYCFFDENNALVSVYPNTIDNPLTAEKVLITIPNNVTKLRICNYKWACESPYIKKCIPKYELKEVNYDKLDNRIVSCFENIYEDEIIITSTSNGAIGIKNTWIESTNPAFQHANIEVHEGETYRITGVPYYQTALYAFAGENGTIFGAYPSVDSGYTSKIYDVLVTIPSGVTQIILNTRNGADSRKGHIFKTSAFKIKSNDVLYGKKWCVCGDSFTEGDFSGYTDADGKSGTESDAYDKLVGHYKTYPYWIGKRNNMNVQWLAKCGSDFTNTSDASSPFSNGNTSKHNYTLIDTDCDYVTFMFGLNESSLTDEQIGTASSTDNTTLWGAYKTVLLDVVEKNPTVKIGIIISDAWLSQKYHDALIEIAKYFGIPYLDLRDGETVPMQIGGKLSSYSTEMKALRDSAFKVASTNGHPNVKAHQYRSTTIENFLRSL